jgi:hypothetical protein
MVIELRFNYNKKQILENIQCYENMPSYSLYEKLFDEVITENDNILKPTGYYVMTSTKDECVVEDFEKYVCCIVTLGKAVDLKMSEYFEIGEYIKGFLLSCICDTVLFSASEELYSIIFNEVRSKGMLLTRRKEPGSCEVALTAQKWILQTVSKIEQADVVLTSGYMLDPTKSMGYFYGAGRDLVYTPIDHDCSACTFANCSHRKR